MKARHTAVQEPALEPALERQDLRPESRQQSLRASRRQRPGQSGCARAPRPRRPGVKPFSAQRRRAVSRSANAARGRRCRVRPIRAPAGGSRDRSRCGGSSRPRSAGTGVTRSRTSPGPQHQSSRRKALAVRNASRTSTIVTANPVSHAARASGIAAPHRKAAARGRGADIEIQLRAADCLGSTGCGRRCAQLARRAADGLLLDGRCQVSECAAIRADEPGVLSPRRAA